MSILVDRFRETVSKVKDIRMKQEAEQNVSYPTGFLAFDYLNGVVTHVKSDKMDFTYNSIGIVDGSMVTLIGRTGCGKTTWMAQAAGKIIKPFKTSCIYHDNIEGGVVESRVESLLEMLPEELQHRYIGRDSGITAENFYERIKIIHDLKISNREDFEYDTGLLNSKGEHIFKLEPTVYMLDSLALLMPEKYTDEEELSGQMSTTAAARTNASIFRRIIPMLKAANIILFVINHITEKVSINPMAKTQAQVSYLKPDESVGGGRIALYVSNLIIRMNDKEKLKESESYGIHGSVVEMQILKSRTTEAGRTIPLIFEFGKGFDRDLSLYYFIKECGLVKGAGAYLYFDGYDNIKFSQKQFKTKLQDSKELQEAFMSTAIIALNTLLQQPEEEKYMNENKIDITSMILSQTMQQPAMA